MLCTPIKLYKQFDKTFKSPTLCLKKFKCWCSYIGTLTQVPTKFYEIQSSRFKEDMLTNCSSRLSFNISKFQKITSSVCSMCIYESVCMCIHVLSSPCGDDTCMFTQTYKLCSLPHLFLYFHVLLFFGCIWYLSNQQ